MLGSPDEERLREVVYDLTGIQVVLDPAEPDVIVTETGKIYLDIKAGGVLGEDNFVRVYDSGLDSIVNYHTGNRLFTMSVKMESYDAAVNAHETLELLRTRLQRDKNLARLRERGMTVAKSEPVVDLPTSYDNRVVSVSAVDFHMALRFSEETTAWLSELTGTRLDHIGGTYDVARTSGELDAAYRARVLAAVQLEEGNYIATMDAEWDPD